MADHHPNPNMNMNMNMKKTSRGKQKIEVKLIEQTSSRQVTFTKRRSGIFKKAAELALLCGAEVAIISFSEARKPFSFAHPSADAVINNFLNKSCPNNISSSSSSYSYPTKLVHEKNKQYKEAVKELEKEKKKMEEDRKNRSGFLWDWPIEKMSLKELEEYTEALLKMRREVVARANELVMRETTTNLFSSNDTAFSPFFADNNEPLVVFSSMSGSAGNHVRFEDLNLDNENWGL